MDRWPAGSPQCDQTAENPGAGRYLARLESNLTSNETDLLLYVQGKSACPEPPGKKEERKNGITSLCGTRAPLVY